MVPVPWNIQHPPMHSHTLTLSRALFSLSQSLSVSLSLSLSLSLSPPLSSLTLARTHTHIHTHSSHREGQAVRDARARLTAGCWRARPPLPRPQTRTPHCPGRVAYTALRKQGSEPGPGYPLASPPVSRAVAPTALGCLSAPRTAPCSQPSATFVPLLQLPRRCSSLDQMQQSSFPAAVQKKPNC